MERTYEAPSNEAPHMILGPRISPGTPGDVPADEFSVEFLVDGSRLSPEPACRFCNSIPFCSCFYYWRNSNQLKTVIQLHWLWRW